MSEHIFLCLKCYRSNTKKTSALLHGMSHWLPGGNRG